MKEESQWGSERTAFEIKKKNQPMSNSLRFPKSEEFEEVIIVVKKII